ncbi:hypothetical protein TOPH_03455 [Tolypocladium ophioglossoides CBS 100239]|uniref:Endonuclease/exonuclease/phosphatase domain-containing protein n=1 Tax=Tolypocladium ophioglossoides (strain CBS 100239) TaxID=1163406 RepID=A0A0L0ND59_TOLOC|nr:hypothetical protein TOPH_03455 [Tolypocladium ophioglossoides CBS 100239]
MASTAFAARRRTIRSSREFRLVLVCLLFYLFLSWCSSSFYPRASIQHSEFDSLRRGVPDAVDMRVNEEQSQEVIALGPPHGMDTAEQKTSMPLRLISFNIRYATRRPVLGEQPWSVRCLKLCTQLRFITAGHQSPFVFLQEALYSQINDVQAQLGSSWAHIGRGRGEGETDGEFSPVFYRADVWKCIRSETRWLSPTPEKPSRGWDAALNRIVTMGEFSHRATNTRVVVMSTHFDHIGVIARNNSAKLPIKFAKEWSSGKGAESSAILIGGDFNSTPDEEAYKAMTAPDSGMSDIADLVAESSKDGNHLTYTSFGEPDESPSRIDFLFIREPRTARIETFGVLANSFDDQIRLSDHRAVVADLDIKV